MKVVSKQPKSTRKSPGYYTLSNATHSVLVVRVVYPNDGVYWIASAEWDRYRVSDPMFTKWEAMEVAKDMLKTATDF